MKYKIPDLKKILEPPKEFYKPGYGLKSSKGKLEILEQGTIPEDKQLLKKLGIKKGEKILAIATFYASWARKLKENGAKVDYSDISKELTNWAKKNYKRKFGKYVCSNYELIPKKEREYSWTFTYEACGGGRGLTLAYLRSLLNVKGGILLIHLGDKKHQIANAPKIKNYPNIVKILSKIYNSNFSVEKKKIKACKRGEDKIVDYEFLVSKIKTNNQARKKAKIDLSILEFTRNKSKINIKEIGKKFKIKENEIKKSLTRLSKLNKTIKEDFFKEVELK
ncbi:MAG: hypothetical protein PVJ67_07035 [Candidatus Pacearchaeota archaeon]